MKRAIIGAVIAVLVLVPVGVSATASSGPTLAQFRGLQRQVNRLQGQVNRIDADVDDLWYDVFVCTFLETTPVLFVDGTIGYQLFYDSLCTSTFKPDTARQSLKRASP